MPCKATGRVEQLAHGAGEEIELIRSKGVCEVGADEKPRKRLKRLA